MSLTGTEALAGLQLLVAVAKADSKLTPAERAVIADALEDAKLPEGITAGALTASSYDVDSLIAQVASQDARDVAFGACLTMAHSNRICSPQAQVILEKIETAWAVPHEKKGMLGRLLHEARDTVWFSPSATPDPQRRTTEIDEDVLDYSILSGMLGLNPVPIASIVMDIAVVGLQAKMFSDVGRHWRHESSRDTVKQIIAGLGVGTATRVAVNELVKFIPGVGSQFAASTNFASTWALGRVANQYWESGGRADLEVLRETFTKSKADGRRSYELHKAAIESKFAAHKPLLDELSAEYRSGRITLLDYERNIVELK